MYEKEGIAYSSQEGISVKVSEVKVLDNMILLLTFNNGEKRLYDATELLLLDGFKKLNDRDIFESPTIIHGVVTWDNESIDIAPETIYYGSHLYNQNDILVA